MGEGSFLRRRATIVGGIHEVGEGLKFSGQLVWNPHEALEPGGKEAVA